MTDTAESTATDFFDPSIRTPEMEMAERGADVPAATMVTAITQSETPMNRARFDACVTIKCPPATIMTRPMKKQTQDIVVALAG